MLHDQAVSFYMWIKVYKSFIPIRTQISRNPCYRLLQLQSNPTDNLEQTTRCTCSKRKQKRITPPPHVLAHLAH